MVKRRNNVIKSKASKAVVPNKLDVLHKDMKDMLEMQRAQETKFVPETPDVPRIRFKDQIVNVELSYSTAVAISTTAPTFGALQFALSNADNYTAYTSCFDQYRVIQANVKILTGPPAVAANAQFLYTVLDYDDAATLSNATAYLGYKTLKLTPIGVLDERTLTPKIAVSVYQGSSFSGYGNSTMWLDSASPNVNYYGLKYYTYTGNMANNIIFVVTLMVQFKQQRSSA